MEHITKAQVKFIRSLQQKKFRDEHGLFVAEGEKCVEELRRGFELVQWVTDTQKLKAVNPETEDQTLTATATEIAQMSSLRTPQGVIGVFKKRTIANHQSPITNHQSPITYPLVLILDGIQDPGNLGTIIRTCDWFGVHSIVCSRDTADCYNPKVVQATMGALARVNLQYVDLPEWLEQLRNINDELRIYGTLLDGKNIYDMLAQTGSEEPTQQNGNPSQRMLSVIIMGNEGNGISSEVRKFITHPLYIPAYAGNGQIKETSDVVESLNVSIATAIVLAEFRRRGL
jgi:TrmH family RNA methyltransferase